ncbi:MAG: TetR family transcriptional regulator [Ilumatobacteraceae bacterium]|nr:MAG: TetR family transcriptional regulator [Actinomycetota bacterium]
MPRDAAATRDLLLDAGQRLFAASGVFSTPLNQVVAAAGQRNASALHYHFGGRQGLLNAILERQGDEIEQERRLVLDRIEVTGAAGDLRALVEAIVHPQAHKLETSGGREFLAIVPQLNELFAMWDSDGSPVQARRALRAIERALPSGLGPDLAHERVTRFLELVTEALGARARLLTRGRETAITNEEFVANLIDMAVGALSAPPGQQVAR